jgi:transcriptional regulator with XRE-family HTH domain
MLHDALRLIRTFHDLKQAEAAGLLGISKSYLSEIESGAKVPTLQIVTRYSEVFEIPMSSILFFAESIEGRGVKRDRAHHFVATKIIALLNFLEAKSVNGAITKT